MSLGSPKLRNNPTSRPRVAPSSKAGRALRIAALIGTSLLAVIGGAGCDDGSPDTAHLASVEKSPEMQQWLQKARLGQIFNENEFEAVIARPDKEAEEILLTLAAVNPERVTAMAHTYKAKPYSEKVNAAGCQKIKESPRLTLLFAHRLEATTTPKFFKEAAGKLLQQNPGDALLVIERFNFFSGEPGATALIEEALQKVNIQTLFSTLKLDNHLPSPLLEKAAWKLAKDQPLAAIMYFSKYQDVGTAKEIFTKALQNASSRKLFKDDHFFESGISTPKDNSFNEMNAMVRTLPDDIQALYRAYAAKAGRNTQPSKKGPHSIRL